MENIWDLRKNQHCFSNASRSHPARHCWVFLCCIASFSSVSDTPNQGEAPIGCLSLLLRVHAGLPRCTQHSQVRFVTPLSVLLCSSEELVCLFRELFCYRSEANLTLQVILELIPLRLFGVVCCAVGGSAAFSAP